MKQEEFTQTLRKLAIFVCGLIAWGLCLLTTAFVISSSGIAYTYRYYTDAILLIGLLIGLILALQRIHILIFALPDQEPTQE